MSNEPVFLRPPPADDEEEDKLGCLDLISASAGMGCATSIRAGIILAAIILVFVVFRLVGAGGTSFEIPNPGGTGRVLAQGIDGWPLVLVYLFYLEEQLRRRVMDKLHARVEIL